MIIQVILVLLLNIAINEVIFKGPTNVAHHRISQLVFSLRQALWWGLGFWGLSLWALRLVCFQKLSHERLLGWTTWFAWDRWTINDTISFLVYCSLSTQSRNITCSSICDIKSYLCITSTERLRNHLLTSNCSWNLWEKESNVPKLQALFLKLNFHNIKCSIVESTAYSSVLARKTE